jgi:hypothetical protein
MSHVWNTTPDSDTGITPFEIEHGMKVRSIPDALLETGPQEVTSAGKDDLTITTTAKAFIKTRNLCKGF